MNIISQLLTGWYYVLEGAFFRVYSSTWVCTLSLFFLLCFELRVTILRCNGTQLLGVYCCCRSGILSFKLPQTPTVMFLAPFGSMNSELGFMDLTRQTSKFWFRFLLPVNFHFNSAFEVYTESFKSQFVPLVFILTTAKIPL